MITIESMEIYVDGWRLMERRLDGMAFRNLDEPLLTLIISENEELDGEYWRHISIAHQQRMPTYEELTNAKRQFAGADERGYLIFPPEKDHVNIHEFALHIFCPIEHNPLPDFTHGTGSI